MVPEKPEVEEFLRNKRWGWSSVTNEVETDNVDVRRRLPPEVTSDWSDTPETNPEVCLN